MPDGFLLRQQPGREPEMTSLVRDFLVDYAHATWCQDDSMQYALTASGMSFAEFTSNWTDLNLARISRWSSIHLELAAAA